jgi:hypothetical protein
MGVLWLQLNDGVEIFKRSSMVFEDLETLCPLVIVYRGLWAKLNALGQRVNSGYKVFLASI